MPVYQPLKLLSQVLWVDHPATLQNFYSSRIQNMEGNSSTERGDLFYVCLVIEMPDCSNIKKFYD